MPSTLTNSGKSKTGAPASNGNRITHGRHSLTMGALPPGCGYIVRVCNAMRAEIETAVVAIRTEISLHDAGTIQTAVRYERHAQLAQRWLRENPGLPVDVKLALSRDIAKASADRDRCLRLLGLDKRASDNVWDCLLESPELQADPLARPTASGPENLPTNAATPPEGPGEATSDSSSIESSEFCGNRGEQCSSS